MPEVSWIKDPSDREIYLANLTRKVGEFTNDRDDVAELVKILTEWRMHLGIKDEPTSLELQFCLDYLKSEYPEYTLEKIRLAVKYSLKGELKVDIKPYGAFSPLYISTILNAYEKFDNKVINGLLREKEQLRLKKLNEPKPLDQDAKIQSRRIYLEYFFNCLHDGQDFWDKGDVAWNFMVNNNLTNPILLESLDYKARVTPDFSPEQSPFDRVANGPALSDEAYMTRKLKHLIMIDYSKDIFIDNFTDEQIML